MSSQSSVCPVIRVVAKNDDGFMEINESDFRKDIHELYKPGKSDAVVIAEADAVEIPPPPAPVKPGKK